MRFFVLVSTLLLLASCSTTPKFNIVPQKDFHFAYQKPSRVLANQSFAQQLASGNTGSTIKIKLHNKSITTAKLGRNYFSASGHNCRKYNVQSNHTYNACNISGRWYETSPIIISK